MPPRDGPFLYDLGGGFDEVESGICHDQGVGGRLGSGRIMVDDGVGVLDMELNGLLMAASASASSHRHRLAPYTNDVSFNSSSSNAAASGMESYNGDETERSVNIVRSSAQFSSSDFSKRGIAPPSSFSPASISAARDSHKISANDENVEQDEIDLEGIGAEIVVRSASLKNDDRDSMNRDAKLEQRWQKMTNVNKRLKSSETINCDSSLCETLSRSAHSGKRVKFDKVHIREYLVVEGSHPCCRAPPAITMGWELADEFRDIPFESFEAVRSPSCSLSSISLSKTKDDGENSPTKETSRPKYFDTHSSSPRRHRRKLRMDVATRRKWLGWSSDEDTQDHSRRSYRKSSYDFEIDFILNSDGDNDDFDFLFGMEDDATSSLMDEDDTKCKSIDFSHPTLNGEEDPFALFENKSEHDALDGENKFGVYNISV